MLEPLTKKEEADYREVVEMMGESAGYSRVGRIFATLDRERGINAALVEALEKIIEAGKTCGGYTPAPASRIAEMTKFARAALAIAKPKE